MYTRASNPTFSARIFLKTFSIPSFTFLEGLLGLSLGLCHGIFQQLVPVYQDCLGHLIQVEELGGVIAIWCTLGDTEGRKRESERVIDFWSTHGDTEGEREKERVMTFWYIQALKLKMREADRVWKYTCQWRLKT